MLEHQQPFDSLPEGRGSALPDEPGLRVTPLAAAGRLLLQSAASSSLRDALKSELGLELPGPQEAVVRDNEALLWLSPAEWLLELSASEIHSVQSALIGRLTASLTVVTDMSDALVSYEVGGVRAAEILMSGCSLDLRAHAFPGGRAARTALADVPAIIWNPGGEPRHLRCIVDRSLAQHLRDWLLRQESSPQSPGFSLRTVDS